MAEVVLGQQKRVEFPCDRGGGTDLTFLVLGPAERFHPPVWGFLHSPGLGHPGGNPMFPIQADHPHYSLAVP